jgi:hypothetical protein
MDHFTESNRFSSIKKKNILHFTNKGFVNAFPPGCSSLFNNVLNNFKTSGSFKLTIHDCFGTLANDAPNVAYLVKNAFIQIYAKSDFLKDFHNFILDYLVKNN